MFHDFQVAKSFFESINTLHSNSKILANSTLFVGAIQQPCQLLGFHIESISASDLKSVSYEVVRRNFACLEHFFDSLDGQVSSAGCALHPCLDAANCEYKPDPDVFVAGTPCQPFSRQRTKRHHPLSVQAHPRYHVTFEDLIGWLEKFEPKSGCIENVEGFDIAEHPGAEDQTSPMQQFLGFVGFLGAMTCPYSMNLFHSVQAWIQRGSFC